MRYLYDCREELLLTYDSILLRHPHLSDGVEVARGKAGETIRLSAPGHYLLAEQIAPGEERLRYLGVIGENTTVVQITVGSFTSDNFDSVVHAARVPVNYYVGLDQTADSTFRGYEQDYGDAVYPHVMANHLGAVDPRYAQCDTNWDSLTKAEIIERLEALDGFWRGRGFAPLHGIATYTPSNSLIAAMKELDWKVLHSVVPEQNWSDGRWAINHWGMPNQPFYVSDEDFRKPCEQGERNVLAMGMNSYHLYMPHVTHWGDNVLSPSHFLRWHRSVESGPEPVRFRAFLEDYLAARSGGQEPFFLIAGFEFGRTFGVRSMTRHNRRGLQLLLEAAQERNMVFATGRDVALYFGERRRNYPENVFTQRDYLAGTRIMDKPVNSGPSIGMEMRDYKAVFDHLSPLPFYHYDYREKWSYPACDVSVPRDYAKEDRDLVQLKEERIVARSPLPRAVPVALWDCELTCGVPFRTFVPARLDDGRTHTVIELPAGWQGELALQIRRVSAPAATEMEGLLRVQKIGEYCYLYPEFQVTRPFEIRWQLPADCRVDAPDRVLGKFAAGDKITLSFDARRLWYRVHGVAPEALRPDRTAEAVLAAEAEASRLFFEEARTRLPEIRQEQDVRFAALLPTGEKVLLEIDCFGNNLFGEKSRARPFDRIVRREGALQAEELSDGGISLGHGKSFWVHPRTLHFELSGLEELEDDAFILTLYNENPHRYRFRAECGGERVPGSETVWNCAENSVYRHVFRKADFPGGVADFFLQPDQLKVLDDWYRDGGFYAVLERLAVSSI